MATGEEAGLLTRRAIPFITKAICHCEDGKADSGNLSRLCCRKKMMKVQSVVMDLPGNTTDYIL
jgi:hypothetical protein